MPRASGGFQLTVTFDASACKEALARYADELAPAIKAAARISADRVAAGQRARLSRQLSGTSSGTTLANIKVTSSGPTGWRVSSTNPRMPMLPRWIEKGTKERTKGHGRGRMPAKPYFWAEVDLEKGPHRRRIEEATEQTAQRLGLGMR